MSSSLGSENFSGSDSANLYEPPVVEFEGARV